MNQRIVPAIDGGHHDARGAKIDTKLHRFMVACFASWWTEPSSLTGGANGGERIVGAEGDLSVDLGKRDSAIQAFEMADGFETDGFREQPVAAGLAAEYFDARLGLRDQSVFFQRFDCPILSGLETAVVSFGGRRKHLDDQRRVQERVVPIVRKPGIAADD